jgi:uncharacterized membrane protein YfcA
MRRGAGAIVALALLLAAGTARARGDAGSARGTPPPSVSLHAPSAAAAHHAAPAGPAGPAGPAATATPGAPAGPVAAAAARAEARPWEWSWRNAAGLALCLATSFAVAPTGGGGGALFMPVFSVLLAFPVADAAAMTSVVILLGCLSSAASSVAAANPAVAPPAPPAPLVDYTTVLVLSPALLLGTGAPPSGELEVGVGRVYIVACRSGQQAARASVQPPTPSLSHPSSTPPPAFGVVANKAMPAWFANVLMIAVWLWALHRLWAAWRGARTLETARAAAAAATKGDVEDGRKPAAAAAAGPAAAPGPAQPARRGRAAAAAAWCAAQPWAVIATIAALLAVSVAASVVLQARATPCGAAFWTALGAQAACCAAAAAATVAWLVVRARRGLGSNSGSSGGPAGAGQAPADATMDVEDAPAVKADAAAAKLSAPAGGRSGSSLLAAGEYWGVAVTIAATAAAADAKKAPAPAAAAKAAAPPPGSEAAGDGDAGSALAAPAAHADEAALSWASPARLLLLQPLLLLIGAWSGALGLGAATLVGPLLLGWGHHPQVAAGTSKIVLLLSTGGAAAAYLAAGRVNLAYAAAYGGVNLAASPVADFVMRRVVARTSRPSHLTLLALAVFVAGAAAQAGWSLGPSLAVAAAGRAGPGLGFPAAAAAVCAPR